MTAIANNTFDCPNVCKANLPPAKLQDNKLDLGLTYSVPPDTRCIYYTDMWQVPKTNQTIVATGSALKNLEFFQSKYPLGANNGTYVDRNNIKKNFRFSVTKNTTLVNNRYILVINMGNDTEYFSTTGPRDPSIVIVEPVKTNATSNKTTSTNTTSTNTTTSTGTTKQSNTTTGGATTRTP